MSTLLSLITGPIGSLLQAIIGPLMAFIGGWTIAKQADAVAAETVAAKVVKAEAEAVAAAPHTETEVVARLLDQKQEI